MAINLKDMQEKLLQQVEREYNEWYNHVREEREHKRKVLDKILPRVKEWEVKIHTLWKNIQLENALFLTDEFAVSILPENGVLGEEIKKNSELVMKYDDESMDLYEQREDIVNYNAVYGLAITKIEDYDDEDEQPIQVSIDPLSAIPDPRNYRGSKMRYIWFDRTVTKEILNSGSYKYVDEIESGLTEELRKNNRAIANSNNLQESREEEWLYAIYDHYTVYNGVKYLTTWANNRSLLIRCEEIEALTSSEKKNPTKVKFPVQLHRRKPKFGSFFGASIADEVLQYQDAISVLTNLQLLQARRDALWPDTYVADSLGIDLATIAEKKPGWRIIPVDMQMGQSIGNSIYTEQPVSQSVLATNTKNELKQLSEETIGTSSLAFGQSMSGTQTKAEIQTLMQNTNQLLSYVGQNYMRGQKEYWEAHYRAYCLYMSKGKRKLISLFQKGNAVSKTLKREDFIADGKAQIYITSKSQEKAENEQAFAKLNAIAGLYLQNMKPWYGMNQFLRKLGETLNVRDFDAKLYIAETPDERTAKANLMLLNAGYEVPAPTAWEDFKTFLDIYTQAIDNPASHKAVQQYSDAYNTFKAPEQLQGKSDSTSTAMAMNTVNSQLSQGNKTPSTQQVSM